MNQQTEPEPTTESAETETNANEESPPLGPIQQVGLVVIAIALGLAMSQFLGLGVISDARLRFLILAGLVCLGGRETIKAVVSIFPP